jgi:hypothetical protein
MAAVETVLVLVVAVVSAVVGGDGGRQKLAQATMPRVLDDVQCRCQRVRTSLWHAAGVEVVVDAKACSPCSQWPHKWREVGHVGVNAVEVEARRE